MADLQRKFVDYSNKAGWRSPYRYLIGSGAATYRFDDPHVTLR
jgi:hypothetical protein